MGVINVSEAKEKILPLCFRIILQNTVHFEPHKEQNHKRDDHLFYLQMFLPESVDVYNISSIRKKKKIKQVSAIQANAFQHIWTDL